MGQYYKERDASKSLLKLCLRAVWNPWAVWPWFTMSILKKHFYLVWKHFNASDTHINTENDMRHVKWHFATYWQLLWRHCCAVRYMGLHFCYSSQGMTKNIWWSVGLSWQFHGPIVTIAMNKITLIVHCFYLFCFVETSCKYNYMIRAGPGWATIYFGDGDRSKI